MKKELKLMGLAIGVVVIMALTLGGTVFADNTEGPGTQGHCAGYGLHSFRGEGAVCSETVSELLGLTPEGLCELRQEGKSLAEIAADQGVAVETLVETITAEKIAAVQARVADGTLTQEQADLMIQRMEERTELAVNRTTTGPGSANHWGGQNGRGTCYGDAGSGTGPGGMHHWGRGTR